MIVIRQAQLDAFRRRSSAPAAAAEIASALRDLGHFDPANAAHREIAGAPDAARAMPALAAFVAAQRAAAARHGIDHDFLLVHWCSFYFRFAADWIGREDVAALLADGGRTAPQRMQAVRDLLYRGALQGR